MMHRGKKVNIERLANRWLVTINGWHFYMPKTLNKKDAVQIALNQYLDEKENGAPVKYA